MPNQHLIEVRDRQVRMVAEHRRENKTDYAAFRLFAC